MNTIGQLGMDYDGNTADLDAALRIEESFDIIGRNLYIAGRRAKLYFIDGFAKDDIMEKIMEFIMGLEQGALDGVQDAGQFADRFVTYVETDVVNRPAAWRSRKTTACCAVHAMGSWKRLCTTPR